MVTYLKKNLDKLVIHRNKPYTIAYLSQDGEYKIIKIYEDEENVLLEDNESR